MLTKPESGWSYFSIDDKHIYPLSYLTEVGLDWLDEAIHGLETLKPFTVHGFCEANRMLCTVSYWNTFVIFEDDQSDKYYDMFGVNLKMIDFCKALYVDISSHIDDWVLWDASELGHLAENEYEERYGETENEAVYQTVYDEIFAERKKKFTDRLDRLKVLISEKEKYFGRNRGFL